MIESVRSSAPSDRAVSLHPCLEAHPSAAGPVTMGARDHGLERLWHCSADIIVSITSTDVLYLHICITDHRQIHSGLAGVLFFSELRQVDRSSLLTLQSMKVRIHVDQLNVENELEGVSIMCR